MAASYAASIAVLSLDLARLRACQVQNALHIGDPINMYGFCSLRSLRALILFDLRVKSHGCPSDGSTLVRSKVNPGIRLCHFPSLISFVTLAGD